MRTVVAVLTYNRRDLFERTMASLQGTALPFGLVVVDNGSTDGTAERVQKLGGICNRTGNHMIGYGFRLAIEAALDQEPELIVFSGDDYEYRDGWLERLAAFWEATPPKVALATCHIEPTHAYNTILGTLDAGGQRALVRGTVPSASWTFRAGLWPEIETMVPGDVHMFDKNVCRYLRQSGRLLCALNLAEHLGHGKHSWTDKPFTFGVPVDFAKWGLA